MKTEDHDLSRLADDGCPHHCDLPTEAEATRHDPEIQRLLDDSILHEANEILARRVAEKYGDDEPTMADYLEATGQYENLDGLGDWTETYEPACDNPDDSPRFDYGTEDWPRE